MRRRSQRRNASGLTVARGSWTVVPLMRQRADVQFLEAANEHDAVRGCLAIVEDTEDVTEALCFTPQGALFGWAGTSVTFASRMAVTPEREAYFRKVYCYASNERYFTEIDPRRFPILSALQDEQLRLLDDLFEDGVEAVDQLLEPERFELVWGQIEQRGYRVAQRELRNPSLAEFHSPWSALHVYAPAVNVYRTRNGLDAEYDASFPPSRGADTVETWARKNLFELDMTMSAMPREGVAPRLTRMLIRPSHELVFPIRQSVHGFIVNACSYNLLV